MTKTKLKEKKHKQTQDILEIEQKKIQVFLLIPSNKEGAKMPSTTT